MADFLFELGCEELPSNLVWALAQELERHLTESLEKAQLSYVNLRSFATPRRLAIYIQELIEKQPSQTIIKRGPLISAAYTAEGKATAAAIGFAKSSGVDITALEVGMSDKGECLMYKVTQEGVETSTLLPTMIQQALSQLTIPKPMRWGNGDTTFARPVQWALMLFGEECLRCDILGIQTNSHTLGHRFHHPDAIPIQQPKDYESALEKAWVIADFNKRKALIETAVHAVAATVQATPIIPEALLHEVTSIVEWPQALLIDFEPGFLKVPHEALIAAMQVHQKCFALQDKTGQLLPHFITIANVAVDNPAEIIAGNAKVMRARLSDAVFFYEQDSKTPLESYYPQTTKVVFQQKLGSLADKTTRMQALMATWSALFDLPEDLSKRAAYLSKCDLMTGMVNEFPELQGLMGYYYAKDSEGSQIAVAIQEQYYPRFSGDVLPSSDLGSLLSLVDRMDTLVGIFGIGQKPSAVKDPFKLRRHALAVIRILAAAKPGILLSKLIHETIQQFGGLLTLATPEIAESLHSFIIDRLTAYYQTQGFSIDKIRAVAAVESDDICSFEQRLQALNIFVEKEECIALSAACKRVNNLLLQQKISTTDIKVELFQHPAEEALFAAIHAQQSNNPYATRLDSLAQLKEPVDAFFTDVMVMVEEDAVKNNRLALLYRLQKTLQTVADISLLNG